MPLQKSDFSNYSIPTFSHFPMEVVLGSRALTIGKKNAVKTQRKQADLSTYFFLVLKSLEIAINRTTTETLVQGLEAMQTA